MSSGYDCPICGYELYLGSTLNVYKYACNRCNKRYKYDRGLVEFPSADLLRVGLEIQNLWKEYAKDARESTNPKMRSLYGSNAAALVHLALRLNLAFSGFEDCVPYFRDQGLLK